MFVEFCHTAAEIQTYVVGLLFYIDKCKQFTFTYYKYIWGGPYMNNTITNIKPIV